MTSQHIYWAHCACSGPHFTYIGPFINNDITAHVFDLNDLTAHVLDVSEVTAHILDLNDTTVTKTLH